jgi:hypothetical protein
VVLDVSSQERERESVLLDERVASTVSDFVSVGVIDSDHDTVDVRENVADLVVSTVIDDVLD